MEANSIVKYKRPLNEDESKCRFVLLAPPEKGKVDMRLICSWHIKPIETVAEDEIELA